MPKYRKDQDESNLNPREKLFCDEYLISLNAADAARKAGYSEKAAKEVGSRLLTRANINAHIKSRLSERLNNLSINQERILREYEKIAFSNITDYLTVSNGRVNLKDTSDISSDALSAVEGYSESLNEYGASLSIKLHNKLKALDALAKYTKLFAEVSEGAGQEELEFED